MAPSKKGDAAKKKKKGETRSSTQAMEGGKDTGRKPSMKKVSRHLQFDRFNSVSKEKINLLFSREDRQVFLLDLSSVTNFLLPAEQLQYLASCHIVSTRGLPKKHIPAIYVFCANSRLLRSDPSVKPLGEKLVELYKRTFNQNKHDMAAIQSLFKENDDDIHFMIVVVKSTQNGTVEASNCEVIAGASCACSKTVGTVLMWIAVDTFRLLTTELVSSSKADDKPLKGRGLGTLLLVTLQSFLSIAGYNETLWAQINCEDTSPSDWYRENLYFAPMLAGKAVPEFVKSKLLDDLALKLFHSTGPLKDIRRPVEFSQEATWDDIFYFSRSILEDSFGMPKRPRKGGAKIKVPPDEFGRMIELNNLINYKPKVPDPENPTVQGVPYADKLRSSPDPSAGRTEIYGNDPEVMGVWAKCIRKHPELKLRYVHAKELGMGNCPGVEHELSCMYLCISRAVFGSEKYYWRLRMATAHAFYAMSHLNGGSPYLDTDHYNFKTTFDQHLDQLIIKGDTDSEDADDFRAFNRILRRFSQKIISGTADACGLEISTLCFLLKGIQVHGLGALTDAKKPAARSRNQSRLWRPYLVSVGGTVLFEPTVAHPKTEEDRREAIRQNLHATDIILLVHVENQHYVAADLDINHFGTGRGIDQSMNQQGDDDDDDVLGHLPRNEFEIGYEIFGLSDEDDEVSVEGDVETYFDEESKSAGNRELYAFGPDQKSFARAVDYVAELTTRDSRAEVKTLKAKKAKLDAAILELSRTPRHRPPNYKRDLAMQKYYMLRIHEVETRLRADEVNEKIEASLHLAKNTKSLMHNGETWLATVKVDSLKQRVIVCVEENWVKANFHQEFVKFMKTFGKVDGFTQLPDDQRPQVLLGEDTVSRARVFGINIRYHFADDGGRHEQEIFYKKQTPDGEYNGKMVRVMVAWEWLETHLGDFPDLKVDIDTLMDKLMHANNKDEDESISLNCRDKHKSEDEHNSSCYRSCAWDIAEDINFTFELDKRQVHSIRWINSEKQWEGLCKSMKVDNREQVTKLSEDWVTTNFTPDQIAAWKQKGSSERHFVKVPAGAPRQSCYVPEALRCKDAPKVAYRQDGLLTCVTDGLSSALSFLQEADLAQNVHEFGMSLTCGGTKPDDEILGRTREFMRAQGRSWTPHRIPHSNNILDANSTLSTTPRLVVLLADDGDGGHAVTIVGRWIFDSNFPCALPLCQASFDLICGEERVMNGIKIGYDFRRPNSASRITKNNPKTKANGKKRCREEEVLVDDAVVL